MKFRDRSVGVTCLKQRETEIVVRVWIVWLRLDDLTECSERFIDVAAPLLDNAE